MTPEPFPAELARCRLAQAAWAATALRHRLRTLDRLRGIIVERLDRLAGAVCDEIGRPIDEAITTELLPLADAVKYASGRAATILAPRRIRKNPVWLAGDRERVERRPWGVVGVIGTWNYPHFLAGVPILQALAAGNGVLWKPSELAPASARELWRAFIDAGVPEDLLVLLPHERDAGPRLAETDVDFLCFTGSANVGRKLAARLGERLIPCVLELSGCDAMVVGESADLTLAVPAAWWGVTLNRGQTCIAARRIFVHRSRYDEFVEQLRTLAASRPHRPEPLCMSAQVEQARRLVEDARTKGAKPLIDVPLTTHDEPPSFPPTILFDGSTDMELCREAAFAAVALVIPFDDNEGGIRAANDSPYALGSSVFADREEAEFYVRRLNAGHITVNDLIAPTAHPATPVRRPRRERVGRHPGRGRPTRDESPRHDFGSG